jgi:hypothetical protein
MWWGNNPNRRQVLFWWWTDQVILNNDINSDDTETPIDAKAKDVISDMRKTILRLKGEYMNETGYVNNKGVTTIQFV